MRSAFVWSLALVGCALLASGVATAEDPAEPNVDPTPAASLEPSGEDNSGAVDASEASEPAAADGSTEAPAASAVEAEAGATPADDGAAADEAVAVQAPPPSIEQLEQALAEQFRLHMEARRYDKAVEVAENAVEVGSLDRDPTDLALAEPLLRLAQAQAAHKDHPAATANFLRAITIIEQREGPFSERLIDPWTSLAAIHHEAGRFEDAIDAIETAIHITRRNHGLFNLEQQDLLGQAADSYLAMGEFSEADRDQRYALRAAQKTYGDQDPRTVNSLRRLAAWYRRVDQYTIERTYLKQAIEVVENAEGPDAAELVNLLRTLAESYRVQRIRHSEAERSLLRALEITERNEEIDFSEQVETLVELGNYHIVHRNAREADEYYRRAWNLLAQQNQTDALRETFGAPRRLVYSAPFAVDLVPERHTQEPPFVELRFTVTEDGRIVDLEVIDSRLPNSLTREVIASLKVARYRPRYVDGVPVRTEGVRLKQAYPVPGLTPQGAADHQAASSDRPPAES